MSGDGERLGEGRVLICLFADSCSGVAAKGYAVIWMDQLRKHGRLHALAGGFLEAMKIFRIQAL